MRNLVAEAEAFARARHAGQRRKGRAAEPYISHVAEVAELARAWGGGEIEIAAAWLHDTVEDCPPTSLDEIAARFGAEVAAVVAELTDDKSLPKARRKEQQIAGAPAKSARACLVKLADKSSNVGALASSPPEDWPAARRRAYLDWAEAVVAGLPHGPAPARAAFAARLARARALLAPG